MCRQGIILEVAPAEAHNWLGVLERKHQVVRRSLEPYMDEVGGATLPALREACIYVPPRINQPDVFYQRILSSTMGVGTYSSTRTVLEP